MAKFCAECGTELGEGTKFCESCGTSVGEGRPSEPPAITGKGMNPTAPYILPTLFLLVIIGLVGWIFFGKEKPAEPPQTAANNGQLPPGHPAMGDVRGGGDGRPPAVPIEVLQEALMLKNQLELSPNDKTANLQLADLWFDNGEYGRSKPYYEKYLTLAKGDQAVAGKLAFVQFEEGDLDGALKRANQGKESYYSQRVLGLVYEKRGNKVKAKAAFDKAKSLAKSKTQKDEIVKDLERVNKR